MKLVSIIIPIYNKSNVISRCYNDLINQVYKNIEIIFVDDGSTDNSIDIINNFKDNRIVLIKQKHLGSYKAIYNGLKKANGEYIIFIDSDYILNKDYIYKLVNIIEKDNSNIVISRIGCYYNYPVVKNIMLKSKKRDKKIDLFKKKEYLSVLSSNIYGKLFRREILVLNKDMINDISMMYLIYIKNRYVSVDNNVLCYRYLSRNETLCWYKLDYLLNIFEPLRYMYDELDRDDLLEDYYYEIEMIFIKNISKIIYNINKCVDDKIYRYKFISVILDYLECFFPDWFVNPYYVRGFKLGEYLDIFYVRYSYEKICEIKRKKLVLSIDDIYDKYRKIEDMYNKSK